MQNLDSKKDEVARRVGSKNPNWKGGKFKWRKDNAFLSNTDRMKDKNSHERQEFEAKKAAHASRMKRFDKLFS